MNNSTLFATFVSQVFTALYDSFPIPIALPREEILVSVESRDEFWDLQREVSNVTRMIEIVEIAGQMTPERKVRAKEKERDVNARLREKELRIRQVESVFDGTVEFLLQEGFLRRVKTSTYQLTLKGFTHLNKSFNKAGITDGPSLIDKLRDALRPENFSGSVTAGTLATLIAKIFGG